MDFSHLSSFGGLFFLNIPVQGSKPDKGGITDVIWGAVPYVLIVLLIAFVLMAFPSLLTRLLGKI
jgi:TRAP-type mannitol/chloroaromatic compound transport system permease large subunit